MDNIQYYVIVWRRVFPDDENWLYNSWKHYCSTEGRVQYDEFERIANNLNYN